MPQSIQSLAIREAWQNGAEASRAAGSEWRKAVAQLASLDQEIAALNTTGLSAIVGMTDCVVRAGKDLLKLLVLQAEMNQLQRQMNAENCPSTAEEKSAALSNPVDLEYPVSPSLESQARHFVADCARRLELCLDWQGDCLDDDDLQAARVFGQHARRLISTLREIQDNWPWSDAEMAEQSWRQYQKGTLMDYETFKHELLKFAE
jgi:hypothetical protein